VTDDARAAANVASNLADLGDQAKQAAEFALTEMQLSRFNLPMTPIQEFILLDRARKMSELTKQVGAAGASALQRARKIFDLLESHTNLIQAGNGPSTAVRLKFARVMTIYGELSHYNLPADEPADETGDAFGVALGVDFERMHRDLTGRMAFGQNPTAADIAKLIHSAVSLASVSRKAAEFEREFNELLVMTVGRTGLAVYYGRSDDATPEACVAERLAACSECVVALYAHAKDAFDFFLGATPELPYQFEFPELSPDEMRRADALLKELAAKRTAK
jgi:hypothetical protein